MLRIMMVLFLAIIAITITFAAVSASSWRRATDAAIASVNAVDRRGTHFDATSLADLPAPAAQYFRATLRDGQPLVRSAIATQEAEFFINGAWHPLRATQYFRASPPAFVWDARIEMIPLLSAWVRDSYIDGRGGLQASLMGAYSLADQVDKPELNAGALQRFLGEAVWLPTALLPSRAVAWTQGGDRSAVATLTDRGVTVSLRFEFDDTGMVRTIRGDRFQEADGNYTLQPWLIHCDEPREFSGMRIPVHCEVSWIVQGQPQPYWRGRVTSITYEFD